MRSTGKMLALMGMAMAAQGGPQPYLYKSGMYDSLPGPELRRWTGGYNNFKGMSFGRPPRHFNKKRHGRMLRRKHARTK